ncbi:MAG: hybrid sensor histidine kinase/response regulator [Deltaproteobacteria bacterium]
MASRTPSGRVAAPEGEVGRLRRELAEAKAALAALAAGQIDAVAAQGGASPVLLREAQEALRRSEERYRRSEESFRGLIEKFPEQIWLHRQGQIVYVNECTLRQLGYGRPEELVGRQVFEFIHPDDRSVVAARIAALPALRDRLPPHEVRLRRRDGSELTVESTVQGILFEGEPSALVVARDLTELKQLQERLMVGDRMASVGMLAAGVAHEINNPLAFILANLDFSAERLRGLVAARPGEELQELVEVLGDAREGAERVRQIVRDLKTFSRHDDAERGPVDIHRLLDSSANMAWNEIRHRSRLVKEYDPAPLLIVGNESRLGQVFLNLLVNAAQAIPEGAAERHRITLKTGTLPDGWVFVEIRDSGQGMTPEVRARLFTPFFTTKPRGIGTGLGLSICHSIVTKLGGEIQVESELGRGTTFRVLLPSGERAAVKAPARALPAAPRRGRILVLDDDAFVASAVRRLLSAEHDVEVATTGAQALTRVAAPPELDAILTDLTMPGMSGQEVYEAIRRDHPELADRVIFMTGGVFTPAARAFLERVPNPRIEKPFDVDALLATVGELLARRG